MHAPQASRNMFEALTTERFLSRGLPALLIGGALLIAAVWWATLQLAATLGQAHVHGKMADVAGKARTVLSQPLSEQEKYGALKWLGQFRDVRRLELRDAQGRLVWRNHASISQVRRALPAPGKTVTEQRIIDGMARIMARHHAVMDVNGRQMHLLLEADVTNMLAYYRQVAVVVAKALTTVLLAAVFLMGWLLLARWREQRALAEELRALLADAGRGEDWRAAVEHLNAQNAAMLRRVLSLAGNDAAQPAHRTQADEQGSARRRRA